MAREPFLPLFFGDFLASTSEWEGEERGLYLLLLGYQWVLGSLPGEPRKLCKLVGWDRELFDRCWQTVRPKFEAIADAIGSDGTCHDDANSSRLGNRRLEEHRIKAAAISEKKSVAGRAGAAARWSKQDGTSIADAIRRDGTCHERASPSVMTSANTSNPSQSNLYEESNSLRSYDSSRAREEDAQLSGSSPEPVLSPAAVDAVLREQATQRFEFEQLRAAYPRFTGRQDWVTAEHRCHVLVEGGEATWGELYAGVVRYATFVAAGGASEPKFVMTPAKFFGAADKPWKQPWVIPESRAETRLAGNVAAAAEAKRRLFGGPK